MIAIKLIVHMVLLKYNLDIQQYKRIMLLTKLPALANMN